MRRRPHRLEARHTVAILVAVAVLLSGLVIAARFYRPEPLASLEPIEITARRIAPDNAAHKLHALAMRLPERPPPLGSHPLAVLRGQGAVLALALGIRRPDDDPEIAAYLHATQTFPESAARVLDESTYYCPPIESLDDNRDYLHSLQELSRVLSGHALYAALQNDEKQALRYILAGLRIGHAVANDGPIENFAAGCAMVSHNAKQAMQLVWSEYREEDTAAFLAALDGIPLPDFDLSAAFDWELRLIDTGVYRSRDGETSALRGRLVNAALRRFARNHRDTLREAAELTYPELSAWMTRHHRVRGAERRALPTRLLSATQTSVGARTDAVTHAQALRIIVALELYRRMSGNYPEELDALAPEILDGVPLDAYACEPFRYVSKGGTYLLYSVGRNQRDDGGDSRRDLVFPPVTASAFGSEIEDEQSP